MKVQIVSILLTLAVTAGFAGEIALTDVDAESTWVIHLDAGGYRTSRMHDNLICFPKDAHALQKMEQLEATFGIDSQKDIASITAYGQAWNPDRGSADGVLLVKGEFEPGKVKGGLTKLQSATEQHNGKSLICVKIPEPQSHKLKAMWMCLADDSTIVIARERGTVVNALAVLAGDRPNAEARNRFPSLATHRGMVVGAAHIGSMPRLGGDHNQARDVQTATFSFAETGTGRQATVTGRLVIETTDTVSAERVKRMADGILALAEMRVNNHKDLADAAPLLAQATISRNGSKLEFVFKHDTDSFSDLLSDLKAKGLIGREARLRRRSRLRDRFSGAR